MREKDLTMRTMKLNMAIKMRRNLLFFLSLSCLLGDIRIAVSQGTAFTYQGYLSDGGNPASGTYDLGFTLLDGLTNGNVIAGPITNSTVAVSNGLFIVTLDFGGTAFSGAPRWLEIGVRTNGSTSFSELAPCQQISTVPYAIYATNAGSALTSAAAAVALTASNLVGAQFNLNTSGLTGTAAFTGSGVISLALTNPITQSVVNVTAEEAAQNATNRIAAQSLVGTLPAAVLPSLLSTSTNGIIFSGGTNQGGSTYGVTNPVVIESINSIISGLSVIPLNSNQVFALDLQPSFGAVDGGAGLAHIDICNTNYTAGFNKTSSGNWVTLAIKTNSAYLGTLGNAASLPPLILGVGGAYNFEILTNGNLVQPNGTEQITNFGAFIEQNTMYLDGAVYGGGAYFIGTIGNTGSAYGTRFSGQGATAAVVLSGAATANWQGSGAGGQVLAGDAAGDSPYSGAVAISTGNGGLTANLATTLLCDTNHDVFITNGSLTVSGNLNVGGSMAVNGMQVITNVAAADTRIFFTGTTNIGNAATSLTINIGHTMPGTNYTPSVSYFNTAGSVPYFSSLTTTNFVLNLSSGILGGATLSWSVMVSP